MEQNPANAGFFCFPAPSSPFLVLPANVNLTLLSLLAENLPYL